MGDPPPNISSILAALAAQQPGGPSPQGSYPSAPAASNASQQSSAPPPSYAGSYQASAQSQSGFSLPQPTNSGNVDLSGVKPVSVGQGIAEAIAKARSIAAEKGVVYNPQAATNRSSDPRLGDRGYRHSRSRSRSPGPARRDNFRDNYNPYRDERREDRRGGGAGGGRDYPRDRSFSPGLRDRRGGPGNTFSPPPGRGYGGRSPGRAMGGGGGPDDNVDVIQVDGGLVGLIIGRQGENLRRVESETGARVQFITDGNAGPNRACKISGSRASRELAKNEIYKVVEENAKPGAGMHGDRSTRAEASSGSGSHQPALRDGEDSMQIMVPDRTVGLIIGRGGETIRDLQERSGCHVNIVGEAKSVNGLRPVNLIGSQEAAAMAKELIMEIVDSDTKSLANQGQGGPQRDPNRGGGGGGGYGGYGGGMGGDGGGRINDSIRVPSEAVGMIIGKGGETIKDMQNTTGCKINVSQQSGPGETDREIGLVGSRDAIEAAKRAIEEKVEVVKSGGRRPPRDDGYNPDRYAHSHQPSSYGAHASHASAGAPSAAVPAATTGDAADPYAAYGGYQNYYAMWYAAMAQQQQQQAAAGQGSGAPPPPPPGAS